MTGSSGRSWRIFSGLIVLDARQSGGGDLGHVDHVHLDREGAKVLSREIAEALVMSRDRLEPTKDRWVRLSELAQAVAHRRGTTAR